jgi:predicted phosphohydrolase
MNPESNVDGLAGAFASKSVDGMSERDRRIFLRELERKNRIQNGQVNQQQYGGPLAV